MYHSMIYTYIYNKKEDPAYQCMFMLWSPTITLIFPAANVIIGLQPKCTCQLILSLAYVVHMDTKSSMCNFLHSCEKTFRVGLLPCFQAKQIPTHISQLNRKGTLDHNVPSVKFLNTKGRLPTSYTNM